MDQANAPLDAAQAADAAFARAKEKPFPTSEVFTDRKSTRLNSSHLSQSRMPSSA